MMKKMIFTTTIFWILIVWGCSSSNQNMYDAQLMLSESEEKEMLYSVMRYMGHLAPRATHETKSDSIYDEHYRELADSHSLQMLYQHPEEGYVYFLITREAPSLYSKQVATGGKLLIDEEGELAYYLEEFRTWKLAEEELTVKSGLLFQEMIDGNDLSIYYPENSGSEEYIEFPNAYTQFDTTTRRWVSTLFNPSADATP